MCGTKRDGVKSLEHRRCRRWRLSPEVRGGGLLIEREERVESVCCVRNERQWIKLKEWGERSDDGRSGVGDGDRSPEQRTWRRVTDESREKGGAVLRERERDKWY